MSSFGSSVINKSGKKIAPKAPVERRRAADSISRQIQQQTTDVTSVRSNAQAESDEPIQNALTDLQSAEAIQAGSSQNIHVPISSLRRDSSTPEATFTAQQAVGESRRQLRATRNRAALDKQKLPESSAKGRKVASGLNRETSRPRTQSDTSIHAATRSVTGVTAISGASARRAEIIEPPTGYQRAKNIPTSISFVPVTEESTLQRGRSTRSTTRSVASAKASNGVLKVTPITRKQSKSAVETETSNSVNPQQLQSTSRPRQRGRRGQAQNQEPSNGGISSSISQRDAWPVPLATHRSPQEAPSTQIPSERNAAEPSQSDGDGESQLRRRKRAMTPEGAENVEIDPSTATMADLSKDTRTGKKSRLETQLRSIDWTEVARKRKEADAATFTVHQNANSNPNVEVDQRLEQADQQATAHQNRGPQLKLVNGEMVIDNTSLTIDRHAEATRNAEHLVEEEATDLTTRINTQSWIYDNRRDPAERTRLPNKSERWTEDQTSAFYDALRMFGTDFYIISKMFPGRTRRHIKLKFVREERLDPARIKEALVGGGVPMDLSSYCEATGKTEDEYKDPKVIEAELRQEEEAQKIEIERQREEAAEARRQRKEEEWKEKEEKAAGRKRARKGVKGAAAVKGKKKTQDSATTELTGDSVDLESAAPVVHGIDGTGDGGGS